MDKIEHKDANSTDADPMKVEATPGQTIVLERRLKGRHIEFIALGGSIGTGLFLGIGRGLTQAGPLSLFLGYVAASVGIFCMMACLGEMTTWLPVPGAIPLFASRFVDPALGFAIGWNNWYYCVITLCAEVSAASVIIQYWPGSQDINPAVWISIIIFVVTVLNLCAVSFYGEAEFVFASIKVITIVGLLILALVIDLGGGPNHDRLGFRYWKDPGVMKEYIGHGATGRFLGFFSSIVNACFSFGGTEFLAVSAGEAENPRKTIPRAVRRVFYRIFLFYVLGSLAVGVLVPYNDSNLLSAQQSNASGAASSPWVVAITRAGIPALPSIINAVILTSASSAANAMVYSGSRYVYGMARNGQAPKLFLKCTKSGTPYASVLLAACISLLSYLSVSSGSNTVFTWFQNIGTISSLLNWAVICLSYIKFYNAVQAQGIDRNSFAYRAPFQPYLGYFGFAFFSIVVFFNGYYSFAPWSAQDFFTSYITLPIFFLLFGSWKVLKKTQWVRSSSADLMSGKAEIDGLEWPESKTRVERVMAHLC